MHSILSIRIALVIGIVLISTFENLVAQNRVNAFDQTSDTLAVETNQKSAVFTIGGFRPSTMENSNFGRATEEKLSFKLGVQIFAYKGLFLGVFHSSSYFDVTNQDVLGRYYKTTVSAFYLQVGYEQRVVDNFSIGASIAPVSNVIYKNIIDSDRIKQQKDDAHFIQYELYLAYNITQTLAVYIDYSYRNDTTGIQTAPEISEDFNNIKFHNFGLGLKIYVGKESLF